MSSILDLHPNAEGFTCVAHAVSKGRGCKNKLDISKRDLAASKLADTGKGIQQAQDQEKMWKETLETVGPLLVCERDGGQVNSVEMR
jgi:hypothetical protein